MSKSQSSNGAMQRIAHAPSAHTGKPLAGGPHALPQPPQSATETENADSQPSARSPLQFPNPATHVSAHRPATHAGVAFGPAGHALPQLPQWNTLD